MSITTDSDINKHFYFCIINISITVMIDPIVMRPNARVSVAELELSPLFIYQNNKRKFFALSGLSSQSQVQTSSVGFTSER